MEKWNGDFTFGANNVDLLAKVDALQITRREMSGAQDVVLGRLKLQGPALVHQVVAGLGAVVGHVEDPLAELAEQVDDVRGVRQGRHMHP